MNFTSPFIEPVPHFAAASLRPGRYRGAAILLPLIVLPLACSANGNGPLFNDNAGGAFGQSGVGGQGAEATAGAAGEGADAGQKPSDEACGNGLDDNQNGFIDENCACQPGTTQPCYPFLPSDAGKGSCKFGSQVCVGETRGEFTSSYWDRCEGYGSPQPEICDGVDNDCDGTVDEGCACSDGQTIDCATACGSGDQTCSDGVWTVCSAPQPQPEACDGVDNDCDGQVDENLSQPCSSACGSGKKQCVNGTWGACDAPSDCTQPCSTVICQGTCCPGGASCCGNGACPDAHGACPCLTVICQGQCCASGSQCCWDGSCPANGQCPPQCSTVVCKGQCCPGGNTCCTNGSCPDANGQCAATCPTVVCDGTCCPKGNACCANQACPDPATGTCDEQIDQCQGKPLAEVYAHSGFTLYRVDPDTKAMTTVGGFFGCGGWQMIDIAMDKNGQLFGTTTQNIARIDKTSGQCTVIAAGTGYPNSLSFVPEGTLDPNHEVLVGYSLGDYVAIDTSTGSMTKIGSLPQGYTSSGDLVSVAGVGTFLTVKGNGCSDCIFKVNPVTGAMLQNLGPIGYPLVYGLAFWKGTMYGFTSGGALFTYDLATKATALVSSGSFSFNGAASSTCAPAL